MLNLDTHILIDMMIGHLSPKEDQLIRKSPWCISDIVLWEIFKLIQLKRIEVDLTTREFQVFLSKFQIIPIDLAIMKELLTLDFSSDPADEIIASTSIAYSIPLLTRDKKIRRSKKVPLAF